MYREWVKTLVILFTEWGTVGTFFAMLLEGLTVPFPGAVIVGLYGLLADHQGILPWITVLVSACGYTIGSLGPYFIGRTGGRKLLSRYGQWVRVPAERLQQLEDWFARYGPKVVCLVRPFFFGGYVSYFAGMGNMNLSRYILYTFLGIAPWCAVLVFGGQYLADKWQRILYSVKESGGWYLVGAVVLAAAVLIGRQVRASLK